MKIEQVSRLRDEALATADFTVDVTKEALPPFDGTRLVNVMSVPRTLKTYPRQDSLFEVSDPSSRMIAIARVELNVVGYVAVSRSWNACVQLDAIMVSRQHRGAGIGASLINEAVSWSKLNAVSILRAETQSTNVPACRFYERCGFNLGGFDRHLYDAISIRPEPETALFWYLHFDA